MKKKIINNIYYSVIEKFFLIGIQFISTVLLVRLLARELYGVLGVVVGYYAFVQIVNVSLEAIIFKDHKNYDADLRKYFYNFWAFNVFKLGIFLIVGCLLSFYFLTRYDNIAFVYAIISITVTLNTESLIAPYIIYASSKFEQKFVTKMNISRGVINLILLLGLFYFPSLKYVALKDCLLGVFSVFLWKSLVYKKFNLTDTKVHFIRDLDLGFIKRSFISFSVWTHLIGVITNFVYKSDTFFLSFFVGLSTVGNYNIALNSANVANILPSILGYQNNVALSNTYGENDAMKISNNFLKLSFLLGVSTILIFFIFGKIYLRLVMGPDPMGQLGEINLYMMCIAIGLVTIKTIASPLTAYICIYGSVQKMLFRVLLPTLIVTISSYLSFSYFWGARGAAMANILIAFSWLIFLIKEIKNYNYVFPKVADLREDWQRISNLISARIYAK